MKLNLYISHSWFSLNRYIIEFINNECMDTVSIFYIPAELSHKISFDLLKLLASKRKSQAYVVIYKGFYYESKGVFENNSVTKKIDFTEYNEITIHFDISNEPKTNNLGGTVIAHYFLQYGYLFREKMRVNVWDAEIHSISSRKSKPTWVEHIDVKDLVLIYDFTKFTEGGMYALGEHFNTTFHLVRPELSEPWYKTINGVLSKLSLDCKFSKQTFMLYLAILGMNGQVFSDVKDIKKTVLVKGPVSFFRMRTPHTQAPGVENSIDYSLALSEVKDKLSIYSEMTVLSGGGDNQKSLHDFTGALEGENNYSQLTPEGLYIS